MKSFTRKIVTTAAIIICTLILPIIGYSQPDPGGNPDGNPPVVPFDKRLNIILIIVGITLAVIVLIRSKKRQSGNSRLAKFVNNESK